MRTITALLLCPIVVIMCVACASHSRETGLRVAYVTTITASDTLDQIEDAFVESIVHTPGITSDVAAAKVATWRSETDRAHGTIAIALKAIAAAAGLNDDASFAAVAAPVKTAIDTVAGLKAEAGIK